MNPPGEKAMDALFDRDEVDEVLRENFYGGEQAQAKSLAEKKAKKKAKKAKKKPDHYRVICISIYEDDLARLDDKVSTLKESGHRKMNRSALIRFALDHVDLDKLPRSY